MDAERKRLSPSEVPKENFSRGLLRVDIPKLGSRIEGKVRDICVVPPNFRIMVTTDRVSAFDCRICTIPGKGQVLNLLSAFWFEKTKDIIPNHMIAIPHPNVLIAKQAKAILPIEVTLRRFMARSSTSTSVYHNYEQGRRKIYGIDFPDGLKANEEFPMGTILTPTTKALTGHDQELTDKQTRQIVDTTFGETMWQRTKEVAFKLFEYGQKHCESKGLILVDTKYEFGIDMNGDLMLIDELHTPDSSRFWLKETYEQKFKAREDPESFDKEILRRWLAEKGFKGKGVVPVVDKNIIDQMAAAYKTPYKMITGQDLPEQNSEPKEIREIILKAFLELVLQK